MKNTRGIPTYVSIEGPSSGVTNRGRENYMSFRNAEILHIFFQVYLHPYQHKLVYIYTGTYSSRHGRTGRKKLGGRKEICPTFSKFPGETLQNCCRRGWGGDYEKFLLDGIFPTKLTEFPAKFRPNLSHLFI
jgi:hypothetical protein